MKKDKNQIVCDRLNDMNLSDQARCAIACYGLEVMAETFGEFKTAEEVEEFVAECCSEEVAEYNEKYGR